MKKILVVDDDIGCRKVLIMCLTRMGYQVNIAENGMDGLEKFKAVAADLVVTDYRMSKMDGYSMITEIKKTSPGTPVLMLTGSFHEDIHRNWREKGVDLLMRKPCDLKELRTSIRRLLQKASHDNVSGSIIKPAVDGLTSPVPKPERKAIV